MKNKFSEDFQDRLNGFRQQFLDYLTNNNIADKQSIEQILDKKKKKSLLAVGYLWVKIIEDVLNLMNVKVLERM